MMPLRRRPGQPPGGPDGWACGQMRADFDALLYVVSNAGRIRPLTEVVRPGGSVVSTVSAADVEALPTTERRACALRWANVAKCCTEFKGVLTQDGLRRLSHSAAGAWWHCPAGLFAGRFWPRFTDKW